MDLIKDLVIQRVVQAIEDNATLISEIQNSVADLEDDLKTFDAYLWKASDDENLKGDVAVKDVVQKMRNLATKADVSINNYITLRKSHTTKGVVTRILVKLPYWYKVRNAASTIKGVAQTAQKIRRNHAQILKLLQAVPNKGQLVPRKEAPTVEKENVVGFITDANLIKGRLIPKVTDDMKVISITGMMGLGKTTLATMLHTDPKVRENYEICDWVYVSGQFDRKQIFLEILCKLNELTDTDHNASDTQLAEKLSEKLEGKKYFVVLDDIRTEEDWGCLKDAFPNNKGSRILVTTQNNLLAERMDSVGDPHKLKELSSKERWELLERKVFGNKKCPSGQLENYGKQIAQKCRLPLELVLIAVVLDGDRSPSSWRKVAENPVAEVAKLREESFNQLPSPLKSCYLYFAAFPKEHDIDAWKLIQLWIAEGLIEISGGRYMEDTAKQYLEELVNKNLVEVLGRRADDGIKTCRVNSFLHELCRSQAADILQLQEIDVSKQQDAGSTNYRRLCVHSSLEKFIGSRKKLPDESIRSFISYSYPSDNQLVTDKKSCATIAKAFPQVKVLEVESIQFASLPKQISKLKHPIYLAISSSEPKLPAFANPWNFQTLVLKNPTQSSIEVEADIWKMSKLRHVRTNWSLRLPPPTKSNNKGDDLAGACLQTLSTISPKSCTEEILGKMPNLKKLGIRGNLAKLLGGSLFDIIQNLNYLENLKLLNTGRADGKLGNVPNHSKFLPYLTKLTLSNTGLGWEDISTLKFLHKLEVLKLDNYAFVGEIWELSDVVFKNLHYFRMGKTNLASWTSCQTSFPVLRKLIIKDCTSLDALPSDFADVESLEFIGLIESKTAVTSAREIEKKKLRKEEKFELCVNQRGQSKSFFCFSHL